jgi:hypothetical protein
MSKFGWRRRQRRSEWRHTATVAASHLIAVQAVPRQVVQPGGGSGLSDGIVVEASVLARLLGIKLLTLEGTVVLSPADLREIGANGGHPLRTASAGAHSQDGRASLASEAEVDSDDGRGIGTRLASAEQIVASCSETLARLGKPAS